MYIFFIISFFILAVLIFLFIFLFSVLQSYFLTALFVPTSWRIARKMLELADLKEGKVFYDLGCGLGTLSILAAKEFGAKAVGVEAVLLFYFLSRLRVKFLGLNKKIKIIRGDLFSQDLSKADVVTIYLSAKTNIRLGKKFRKELKTGARIISRAFKMPGWLPKAVDKKDKLYLYEIA